MDVSFHHKTPRHKQYLAIPTLLKARTSRRCGETSAVLKDRKRGTENSTGKGWVMGFVRLIEDSGLVAMVMGREEVGRAILRRRRRLPRQESLLRGLFRPLRPYPGFRESDSPEPASLHLLQHTRSARRNYRVAGARLVRSNYPPPLSSAALGGTGTTRRN
ncbi:LOW QUALITY PROTEIN: putative uncharacterized protein encoded by LINC03040 [Physeter macrocephalus]|uniref:Uncharacterized protein n=1 Tax=Physeter macrocephalus TaxID=9755 RepID=A0A455ATX6_PHYMC|nr:LOW QUALITY PROTEIN: putative uncharacterized protein encoded by LINC03040 [Physeter catodon]|eukprot:XP_028335321.1 LOW QUALITY PROTEIN: uncharacterized protein C6orf223 homolog [Physeter catodon]